MSETTASAETPTEQNLPRPSRRPYWTLNLYREAGEAGGCLRVPALAERSGGRTDPERVALEAARRARGTIRRYCAANRLNRLGTLTYAGAGCHEPTELRHDVAAFFKRLRRDLGGERFPYLWVPEWHPVPVGSGSLEEARLSARYLAKYAGKAIDAERRPGLHRYEVAQGYKPQPIYCDGTTAEDVIRQASAFMGRAPAYVWHSSREDGWLRPPVCWLAWAE